MSRLALRVCLAVIAVTVAAPAVFAQSGGPDPAAHLKGVMQNGRLRSTGTGELFCWHASAAAESFLDAYDVYRNPEWLAAAEKYYEFYLGKLSKDPDGYEGWIGDPVAVQGAQLSTDAVVGDSILCAPLVRFAEIVKNNPSLEGRFGATAKRYVDLATRICWEKWNHRECYYEDAAGNGSYHTYGKLVDTLNNKWVDAPSRVISENLNKHYQVSRVLLRLWRVTGKPEYRERVIRVYGRAKTMWRYYPDEDRIVWNFWMPHGPWDLEGRAPKSWVGVHSSRAGYQAGEVGMFVEVYDSGLVFEKADFERMARTNLWMHEGGKWRCADGTSDAGTLWGELARFNDTIRTEAEKQAGGNQIARDYLKYVLEKTAGGKRLYCNDTSKVQVVKTELQPGQSIAMSIAVPDWVETANDDRLQLACQTRAQGTLKIELLDASGKQVLGTLAEIETGKGSEFNAPFWDGTNPKTGKKDVGQYTVRWSLAGESRTTPVWVKVGKKRPRSGPPLLEAGQTVTFDFEKAVDGDPRWNLDGAETSMAQARGGKHSLEVKRSARLVFGERTDLPVKVSMWVYDNGIKFGKAGKTGPGWGVMNAMGDKFCLRQVWRPYLGGDTQYAWFNTGENGWFSPHPAGVTRKTGWVEFVFDFSDPSKVKITGDGTAVRGLSPKFTPQGAVQIYLENGDGGPLYVDDITVEYPQK